MSRNKKPTNMGLDLFNEKSFCRNIFNCSNCELRLFITDFKRKIFINLFPNCGLSVIRYYGGAKLGKRSLIDTYGNSARELIEKSSCKKWVKMERYAITSPMDFYGDLAQSIPRLGGKIIDDQSGELLKWNIEVQSGNLNELIQTIRTVTKGEGDFEKI